VITILYGVLVAAAFIALLRLARGEHLWPRTQPASSPVSYSGFHDDEITVVTPIGIFTTGFAWCPECTGREVVIVHADQSAHCDRCSTPIPAGEAA
jgi:hypothetical protein